MAKKFELKNPDAPMSFKQGIMIRNLGGGDVRGENLTMQEASDRIQELMDAKGNDPKAAPKVGFDELWTSAREAGVEAGNEIDFFGGCGFAWVNFKMKSGLGRKFGRWLIDNGHARKDGYYGGVTIWISDHDQNVAAKEKNASVVAEKLREAGIESAYAMSRLD